MFQEESLNHFTPPSHEPYRILIVDDAQSVRESLSWLLLDELDFDVVGDAASGSAAMRQAVELNPDLVILDIELPDIDGFHVTRQLKALPRPPLVVLLSIHSDDLSKRRGVQAGCDAFVEKGLGWPGLLAVLQKVLNER
ncbi:MAG TPA: response regulator transcription factor [Anaerolineales bacterium]|nr:response regulator transcription factor [Anaerolineales bacterium]